MASYKESDPTLGYLTKKETEVKVPRATRVKNKTPAPIQITAEQILREARERQESEIRPPKQKITDSTELADYRLRKRKEYEDLIRRVRWNISVWVKYAQWEESQKDFKRARSVWERALEVDYRNHTLWLKYADMEMKNKFVNHARNVWDRAVSLLPRVDQLWYKYIHMEEMLGNVAGARQVFERWMQWQPDQQGWRSYIKFELRYNEIERAREIYERYVDCHPKVEAWIRYAKFEMKNGEIARARNCYERAVGKLADDEEAEQLFVAFAEFEERCKETERARCIYKFALDHIPKGRAEEVYKKFVAFEKQYGDKEGIDDAIVGKRRFQYEDEVRKNPLNYDTWFDYIRLEESVGIQSRVREVYERAIANVPPAEEKRYWQRYIYLWINYALYEELDAQDIERTREVYSECLKLIPHNKFSFAKIWLLAAQFEIRQLNLNGARQILGNSIGRAPKDKIFKKYIEIELQLGNIDRCRKLYEKYLEWSPENCYAWTKYAELERSLCETDRARAIYELAIAQPALDMPELLSGGVDVLSLSLEGNAKPYDQDNVIIAAFGASEKGLVVSFAAGNYGPLSSTVGNVAPWVMTVAASSLVRSFIGQVKLGNGMAFNGASLFSTNEKNTKQLPLAYKETAGARREAEYCLPGSLSSSLVKGKIVVCV